jgi:hypothetical protein
LDNCSVDIEVQYAGGGECRKIEKLNVIAGDECMVYSFALADREITLVFHLSEKSKGIRLHHQTGPAKSTAFITKVPFLFWE